MSALISLSHCTKRYTMGSSEVCALNDVSLEIEEGEFVAIMGASGSGKSTMLNILGLLDTPDGGDYKILGRSTLGLDEDRLSMLRNSIAGFVFQQFQLLPRVSAIDNVLMPTVYAGKKNMHGSAAECLDKVGLAHRVGHTPNELSGGEQQRVAIARSLVNEPLIIFADEPTGNLDTKSEEEIIALLKILHAEGKTIIMVTHEHEVAAHASRIITMRDGKIIEDCRSGKKIRRSSSSANSSRIDSVFHSASGSAARAEYSDYLKQAGRSIVAHKMRSLLSMLGILIGVAAVITMLAVGEGAKASISSNLASLGTNILSVHPGRFKSGGVSLSAGTVTRLSVKDAQALTAIPSVKRISPTVSGRAQAVCGDKNWNTQVSGVSIDYQFMRASTPVAGRFFTEKEYREREKVALVGVTVLRELFGNTDPVGKKIRLNRSSFTVIGVLPAKGAQMFRDQDDIIVIPLTTAMYRVLGSSYVDSIDVEVSDALLIDSTMNDMTELLRKRKGIQPGDEDTFEIHDMSEIRKTMEKTTDTMSMLLGSVAAISLIVGGVGVMNIMLVSVRERTREIGLRKAIGARRKDILHQFLVEAVMMTVCGGAAGVFLGIGASVLVSVVAGWTVKISAVSVAGSLLFSVMVGICFGMWPAMQGSRLRPIDALRYE